jgi:hypothetical protein
LDRSKRYASGAIWFGRFEPDDLEVAAVTQVPAPSAALADVWHTYHNDRYGTTIDYPSVFKPGTPPGNDDGLAFASADGAEFSVFASYNALDFDLAGFQDFVAKNLGAERGDHLSGARRRLVCHLRHERERPHLL